MEIKTDKQIGIEYIIKGNQHISYFEAERVIEIIKRNLKCDCNLFPKQCELHKILGELSQK